MATTRPPLDEEEEEGITTEIIRPVTRSAIYRSPTLRPASAWLCITLCGQAVLLHNMPVFIYGRLQLQQMGLVVEKDVRPKKRKKKKRKRFVTIYL
jgi:hypothetical protein